MNLEEISIQTASLEEMIRAGRDFIVAAGHAAQILELISKQQHMLPESNNEQILTLRVRLLLVLSEAEWRQGNARIALAPAEQAYLLCEQIGSATLSAQACGNMGTVYIYLADYPRALEYYTRSLDFYEQSGDMAGVARHTSNIGLVYSNLSQYPRALEYYERSLKCFSELGNKNGMATTLSNMGIVYMQTSDYTRALEYYHQALSLFEELENKMGIARNTGNIGNIYFLLSEYQKALDYMTRALHLHEEMGNLTSVAANTGNIGIVYRHLSNYPKALEYMSRALALDEQLGNKAGIASGSGNIGLVYQNLSDYTKALEYYRRSLAMAEKLGNKAGVATNIGNIGNVYLLLADYPKALEYYTRARVLDQETGNKAGLAVHTGSIGQVYQNLADYPRALEYFQHALDINEELGNKAGVSTNIGHLGNVHLLLHNYDQALEYYQRALQIDEELGNKAGVAAHTAGIGAVYARREYKGYNPAKAEQYLLQATAMNQELGTKQYLYANHKVLAEFYEDTENWKQAYIHRTHFQELEKQVQSEEARQKAGQLDYERKNAMREKQIAVERARAEAVEMVLQNTLPPLIAERLIRKETFIADYYENVSVLFMDLVDFTGIAGHLKPRHLIYFLNSIFSEADAVVQRYGLEKIKTIGDAYMAVCGAPMANNQHALMAAQAALDMLDTMKTLTVKIPAHLADGMAKDSIGNIKVRIGIHCGEAIGGVIGDKKYSFDLWGVTVNTASRMESKGLMGHVHVSGDFVQELLNTVSANTHLMPEQEIIIPDTKIKAIPRGIMDIKGKGAMQTYFLERV
jgi:tetratricopeptide (TPR) repeat protein